MARHLDLAAGDHQMILKKAFALLAFVLMVPVLALACLLTIWAADREEPVHINRVRVVPPNVKACDQIDLVIYRTGYRSTGVHIERFFVDSEGERAPLPNMDYDDNPGPLGDFSYKLAFTVPCSFAPGWAYYQGITTYHRNPLQKYLWPIPGGMRRTWFCVFTDAVGPEQACKPDAHPPQD